MVLRTRRSALRSRPDAFCYGLRWRSRLLPSPFRFLEGRRDFRKLFGFVPLSVMELSIASITMSAATSSPQKSPRPGISMEQNGRQPLKQRTGREFAGLRAEPVCRRLLLPVNRASGEGWTSGPSPPPLASARASFPICLPPKFFMGFAGGGLFTSLGAQEVRKRFHGPEAYQVEVTARIVGLAAPGKAALPQSAGSIGNSKAPMRISRLTTHDDQQVSRPHPRRHPEPK